MKKNIILLLALFASSAQSVEITIINWSKTHAIDISSASAGTNQSRISLSLSPKTGQIIEINPVGKLKLSATFFTPFGIEFDVKDWTDLATKQHKSVFILDAGNSFFNGLSTTATTSSTAQLLVERQKGSLKREIRFLPLDTAEPLVKTIESKIKMEGVRKETPKEAPKPKPSNNITYAQLKADPVMLSPHDITTLTIEQRFVLFGLDPKLAKNYPGDNAPVEQLLPWAKNLQPQIAAQASATKTRYRKLTFKYHPDRNPNGGKEATQVITDTFRLFDPHGSLFE